MLSNQLIPIGQLSSVQRTRMYDLFAANYDKTSEQQFFDDLSNKQFILLLTDEVNIIQGFSTVGVNPKGCGTADYNILFSGDTIISPEHWGTQELAKGFTETVGKLVASDEEKDWYWFLMSKGHRTYMYLAIFFEAYYPHVKEGHPKLKQILDKVAFTLFGNYWKPEADLIVFPESMGELSSELAQGTFDKQKNKHVAFFLEKNPRFYKGEELACITPLHLENFHPRMRKYWEQGYEEGLPKAEGLVIK